MLYVNTSNMDSESLIYKWEYADTPDSTSWTEVSGNDNPSLTINTNMLGKHVRVTVNGSIISQTILIPNPPNVVITTSFSGSNTILTADTNIDNPIYEWISNDVIIAGQTTQNYTISNDDTNKYKVKVTNFNDSNITVTSGEYTNPNFSFASGGGGGGGGGGYT